MSNVNLDAEMRKALAAMERARRTADAIEANAIRYFQRERALGRLTLRWDPVALGKQWTRTDPAWRSAVSRYEFNAGRVRTLSAALAVLREGVRGG